MSKLIVSHTLNDTIKANRLRVANGDTESLLKEIRQFGLKLTLIGLAFAALLTVLVFVTKPSKWNEYSMFILYGAVTAYVLCIGITALINPKRNKRYRGYYLNTIKFISRNTGFPQKPYVPEEWVVPLTSYDPDSMANILRMANAWGENNTFFICNNMSGAPYRKYRSTKKRIRNAFLFNLCEKGLFLVPISNDNGVVNAYPDLCCVLPLDKLNKLYIIPLVSFSVHDKYFFSIWSDPKDWRLNAVGDSYKATLPYEFCVSKSIDGAPFHEFNVTKLYNTYHESLI